MNKMMLSLCMFFHFMILPSQNDSCLSKISNIDKPTQTAILITAGYAVISYKKNFSVILRNFESAKKCWEERYDKKDETKKSIVCPLVKVKISSLKEAESFNILHSSKIVSSFEDSILKKTTISEISHAKIQFEPILPKIKNLIEKKQ